MYQDTFLTHTPNFLLESPFPVFTVGNLTAHTSYEISAWAKTDLGDSPLAFEHVMTRGVRPPAPSLKAKAINQTAVECTWTGPRNVVSQPEWPSQSECGLSPNATPPHNSRAFLSFANVLVPLLLLDIGLSFSFVFIRALWFTMIRSVLLFESTVLLSTPPQCVSFAFRSTVPRLLAHSSPSCLCTWLMPFLLLGVLPSSCYARKSSLL